MITENIDYTSQESPTTSQTPAPTVLLSLINPTSLTYRTYSNYNYTWNATGSSATLSFFFRNDPGSWMLDDITVYHGSTQLISNGGFEVGLLADWTYSGSCNFLTGSVALSLGNAKSGSWYYKSPCANYGDKISQTFSTVLGDSYVINFWLKNPDCCSSTQIANVTIG